MPLVPTTVKVNRSQTFGLSSPSIGATAWPVLPTNGPANGCEWSEWCSLIVVEIELDASGWPLPSVAETEYEIVSPAW